MLTTLIDILHIFVCLLLMLVVLLQQGKGGGIGAAFGGGGAAQVFGGRGAGNLLTRTTAICATIFMLTSVSLAYLSTSGDRLLKAKVGMAEKKRAEQGSQRPKDAVAAPAASGAAAPKSDEKANGKPEEKPAEQAPKQ